MKYILIVGIFLLLAFAFINFADAACDDEVCKMSCAFKHQGGACKGGRCDCSGRA